MTDMNDEMVDAMFDWMMVNEARIDDVITSLAGVGVVVAPSQRLILTVWLDGAGSDTRIPLPARLELLKDWLASC